MNLIWRLKKYITKRNQKKNYNLHRAKNKHNAFCWAPFTSLRFHRNGNIQVCCYHIDFISLENRSLKDIWFGPELRILREQMKQYKMPASCNFCTSNYLAGNYNNINALAYDEYEVSENGYPVFMDFSLSNTCNLSCIMCDASLSSGIQKAKNIVSGKKNFIYEDNFLIQLQEFIPFLKRAVFTGGEPFLIEFYYKLWSEILRINKNIEINVTTNGTVYNQKVEDLLKKGRFNIAVSVESFNKGNYEKIRMGASYENMLNNITRFAQYCKNAGTHFSVVVCPMSLNWQDIPALVEKCNFENWQFSYNVVIKPALLAIWNLDVEILNEIINFYENFKFVPNNQALTRNNISRFKALVELFKSWKALVIEMKTTHNLQICLLLKKEILSWCRKKCNEQLYSDIDITRIENIFNKIPDIFFNRQFETYIYGIGFGLLVNELRNYDDDTIVDHLTIVGFNMLFLFKNKKNI